MSRPWNTWIVLLLLQTTVSSLAVASQWAQWEWLNPRPQGYRLNDVASSDTTAVAVGEQGVILVSENGVEWSVVRTSSGQILKGVTWAGDRFLAVGGYRIPGVWRGYGGGFVLSSPDGYEWTLQHVIDALGILTDVIYNGEQFLAVGSPGISLTSPDGYSWTEHQIADLEDGFVSGVAWNGSLYVSVGERNVLTYSRGIFLSDDGVNWYHADYGDLVQGGALSSVVWGHGRFLASGAQSGYVKQSVDGYTWSRATSLPGIADHMIVTSEGYATATRDGNVAWSLDGVTWESEQVAPFPKSLHGLTEFLGKALVVGNDGAIGIEVDSPAEWNLITTWGVDLPDSHEIEHMSSGDGVLIGIATDGLIVRSENEYDWEIIMDVPDTLYLTRWIEGTFWVLGRGVVYSSTDGLSWQTRLEETWTTNFTDIASSGEVEVIVGATQDDGWHAMAVVSDNGEDWQHINIEGGEDIRIASVTWDGGLFIAVGLHGTVFRSTNGIDWDISRVEDAHSLSRIVSNGRETVAVGGFGEGFIASTRDGVSWQVMDTERTVRDIAWTGEQFVAVDQGGGMYTSSFGMEWSAENAGYSFYPRCVTFHNGALIAAGWNGGILKARPIRNALDERDPKLKGQIFDEALLQEATPGG